jgi:membrane-bound lytic murein transglycosylase B
MLITSITIFSLTRINTFLRSVSRCLALAMIFSLLGCAAQSSGSSSAGASDTSVSASGKSSTNTSNRLGAAEPTPETLPPNAPADDLAASGTRSEVRQFAKELAVSRNLPEASILGLLNEARYSATVAKFIAPAVSGQVIPPKSWQTYRGRRLDQVTISQGRAFIKQNATTLDQATERYGVPGHIIAALIGVETLYGRNQGNFRVLDALATLAFDYPDPNRPERAALFRNNLADLIELDLTGKLNARTLKGSYAGAVGIPQFMPSSIKRFAVSAQGNKKLDLNNNPADAIMSVANYLVEHGWVRGIPVFAPVLLPSNAATLVDGGLKPTLDWPQLKVAGASLEPGASAQQAWARVALGVVDLPEQAAGTAEFRTATPNFFALTQYNHSYFYAAAIADLSEALVRR